MPSLPRMAMEACAGVIAGSPALIAEIPDRDTLITTRWLHPALHDAMPALPVHVVGTYHGAPVSRVWRCGNMRLAGTGRAGGMAVVPAGWGGQWDIEAEGHLSYVFLSDSRLRGFADQWLAGGRKVELAPCIGREDPVGAHILRVLSRYAARPDPSAGLFVEQALDHLCLHLIRAYSTAAGPDVIRSHGLAPWQERRAKEMLLASIDGRIGLDELARACGLSRSHFARAFKATTGTPPFQWLLARRIERAKDLLLDTALPIDRIAHRCGFTDQSHFTRAFLKAVEVPPGLWRRSRRL